MQYSCISDQKIPGRNGHIDTAFVIQIGGRSLRIFMTDLRVVAAKYVLREATPMRFWNDPQASVHRCGIDEILHEKKLMRNRTGAFRFTPPRPIVVPISSLRMGLPRDDIAPPIANG